MHFILIIPGSGNQHSGLTFWVIDSFVHLDFLKSQFIMAEFTKKPRLLSPSRMDIVDTLVQKKVLSFEFTTSIGSDLQLLHI